MPTLALTPDYTREQLVEWLKVKLGGTVWRLEGMSSRNGTLIEAAVDEAMMAYSTQIPAFRWDVIPAGTTRYQLVTRPERPLQVVGVARVDFIEPYNSYGMGATGFGLTQNLTGVTIPPILSASAGGAGEIIEFMQWRKSFQRVTSRKPNWKYDDLTQTILISNPVNYHACALVTVMRDFAAVRIQHKELLKNLALANARISLGDVRSKFGEIRGPGMQSVGLNGDGLITRGDKDLEKYTTELKAIRPRLLPSWD